MVGVGLRSKLGLGYGLGWSTGAFVSTAIRFYSGANGREKWLRARGRARGLEVG